MGAALVAQPAPVDDPVEGTDMDEVTEVVRARRVEVMDREGRVRVVIGDVSVNDEELFGVVVRNALGRDRAWMLAQEVVAEIGLDHAGDTIAALTVSDDGAGSLYVAD
ncbi:MAG TPA: hypothetical protein VF230_11260 [Acidimicrobiales bacterium]